jgi:hypothetical protein
VDEDARLRLLRQGEDVLIADLPPECAMGRVSRSTSAPSIAVTTPSTDTYLYGACSVCAQSATRVPTPRSRPFLESRPVMNASSPPGV